MKKKWIVAAILLPICIFTVTACRNEKKPLPEEVETVATEAETEVQTEAQTVRLTEQETEKETNEVKPMEFQWKENMSVELFIGIDNSNNSEEADSTIVDDENQTTMADALFLVATDNESSETKIIGINRDTITDVDVYDAQGEFFRTMQMQIALSHGYGLTEEEQCENTVKAVSNLFGGLPIDHYVAMKMAAIPILNDTLGGITVEVLEDMTSVDTALSLNEEVTLKGNQALEYVKWRDTDNLDSSSQRVARQQQYISALAEKLTSDDTMKNIITMQKVRTLMKQYMVTNCSDADITALFRYMKDSALGKDAFYTVPGEIQQGDIYAEFIVDQKALNEMEEDIFVLKES